MILMKKRVKHIIGVFIAGVVIYNSLYFRPLDEKLAEGNKTAFDAKSYVDEIWSINLLPAYDSSTDIIVLLDALKKNPESGFTQKGQALGIGNIGYFKAQGEGTVLSVNENNVLLKVGGQIIEIETEFIFGNAVRDASGLIKVNDYDETADFNSISESINDKIRKEVIPDFRQEVEKGSSVNFKGAIELNKAHLKLSQPEVIPVTLQIIQ